jgi:hypothetical protein
LKQEEDELRRLTVGCDGARFEGGNASRDVVESTLLLFANGRPFLERSHIEKPSLEKRLISLNDVRKLSFSANRLQYGRSHFFGERGSSLLDVLACDTRDLIQEPLDEREGQRTDVATLATLSADSCHIGMKKPQFDRHEQIFNEPPGTAEDPRTEKPQHAWIGLCDTTWREEDTDMCVVTHL